METKTYEQEYKKILDNLRNEIIEHDSDVKSLKFYRNAYYIMRGEAKAQQIKHTMLENENIMLMNKIADLQDQELERDKLAFSKLPDEG